MSQQAELVEFFESLSLEERAMFLRSQPRVRALLTRLLVVEGGVFTHELDRSPGVIGRLVAAGAYTGYVNPTITDEAFPVTVGGIVAIRYRIVSGHVLKRDDGWVYRPDVEVRFREMRMRFGDPDEVLLPPARDLRLGRGKNPYAAFLRGLPEVFVADEGRSGGRGLDRHSADGVGWDPICVFVGVCDCE